MNENIDLTKILENCPEGTEFYSTIYGYVTFIRINDISTFPIILRAGDGSYPTVTKYGRHSETYEGECTLFPSKDQRDWSKFTAPWYKKDRFDPNTLKPFDKVLVKYYNSDYWSCGFFSHISVSEVVYRYATENNLYTYCIPYNDDTKHLVGTTDEAPVFYRYWEY